MLAHNHNCWRGGIVVRDLQTWKSLLELDINWYRCPNDLAFSPNSKILAVAWKCSVRSCEKEPGKVSLINTETGSVLDVPWLHGTAITFSSDGKTVAAGDTEGTVWILDAETGQVVRRLEGHTDQVSKVTFSPDGSLLAVGLWDTTNSLGALNPTIELWDTRTGTRLHVLQDYAARVSGLSFSPDGAWLLSGSPDGTVRLWGVR
jgi:WD40 repeat protein